MYTVLVVEDELLIRDAIAQMVQQLPGFQVVGEAASCEEAWRLLQELWPTVVITDIQLPDQDGLELIKWIREHQLPIVSIIISGHDRFQYAQNAIRLQVSEYLLKPISEPELHSALTRSLSRLEMIMPSNRILLDMQQVVDSLLELDAVQLHDRVKAIVEAVLRLRTADRGTRISYLRMFWTKLLELVKAIHPDYKEAEFYDMLDDHQIRRQFQELAHDWLRYYPQFAGSNMRMVIKKACDYTWEHYQEELTSKQLADYCNLSPSYFGVLFKQYTGQSFINYWNQIRIEQAMELLRKTDKKIYEVAEEVGYVSLPYFNRVFKHVSSYTPNEYRKNIGL
jgi:two-component system response regulator YesN